MKILGIETSCDDTGVAVLEIKASKNSPRFYLLSNIVASQIETHRPYGGVYPMLAKREHIKNLPIVLEKSLKEAKISNPKKEIDLLAVTNGPGLEPCLWTGVNFAKELSKLWNVPIVGINHIEAHILVNFLENKEIKFPAICLVASGGHTQLILMKKIGNYKIIGETRDDAAGECFDKCAKILGLGYPGGPIISKMAKNQKTKKLFPSPMMNTKDYDFSFSGLKTAVLYHHQKQNKKTQKNKKYILQMCAEIQQAIIAVLIKKTIRAVKDYNAKTLILGGGVSANQELRKQFQQALEKENSNNSSRFKAFSLLYPPANFSTDNGLMTAVAGYLHKNRKISPEALKADANLRIK